MIFSASESNVRKGSLWDNRRAIWWLWILFGLCVIQSAPKPAFPPVFSETVTPVNSPAPTYCCSYVMPKHAFLVMLLSPCIRHCLRIVTRLKSALFYFPFSPHSLIMTLVSQLTSPHRDPWLTPWLISGRSAHHPSVFPPQSFYQWCGFTYPVTLWWKWCGWRDNSVHFIWFKSIKVPPYCLCGFIQGSKRLCSPVCHETVTLTPCL